MGRERERAANTLRRDGSRSRLRRVTLSAVAALEHSQGSRTSASQSYIVREAARLIFGEYNKGRSSPASRPLKVSVQPPRPAQRRPSVRSRRMLCRRASQTRRHEGWTSQRVGRRGRKEGRTFSVVLRVEDEHAGHADDLEAGPLCHLGEALGLNLCRASGRESALVSSPRRQKQEGKPCRRTSLSKTKVGNVTPSR